MNHALAHDDSASNRLKPLSQKVVHINVAELPMPFVFRFMESEIMMLGPDYEHVDAKVTFSIFDAPLLMDAAQATAAIQAGKLQVQGDPILLQQAADVFVKLDIDWEELLSSVIGDVPAHLMAKKIRALHKPGRLQEAQGRVQELLVEELQLAASSVDFEYVKADIRAMNERLSALESDLRKLQ
ncbi:SCP2 domain-containing protein [Lysobacter sp. N42]|uniref:ubiquinone biosynthesis accessory factor UbiJ n=1 Tax=Lysobacter sp. N42 TaxID=2545719 RepID=UPI0014045801|nr:SCP2 sterol-binding domain-containing protein [Lysobacter sp. N42]